MIKKIFILMFLASTCYASPKWEIVTNGWNNIDCYRLWVPDGWLVAVIGYNGFFYPDKYHKWKLE